MTMRITAVAIRLDDGSIHALPAPARHHDVIAMLRADGYTTEKVSGGRQGFGTNTGLFLGRKAALTVAREAGQMKPRQPGQYDGPELFSEDLW